MFNWFLYLDPIIHLGLRTLGNWPVAYISFDFFQFLDERATMLMWESNDTMSGQAFQTREPSAQGKVELIGNSRAVWLWLSDTMWLPAAVRVLLKAWLSSSSLFSSREPIALFLSLSKPLDQLLYTTERWKGRPEMLMPSSLCLFLIILLLILVIILSLLIMQGNSHLSVTEPV